MSCTESPQRDRNSFPKSSRAAETERSWLLTALERLACDYSGDQMIQQMKELSISKKVLRESLKANENQAIFEGSVAPIDAPD